MQARRVKGQPRSGDWALTLNNEMHEVRTSCLGTLALWREARKGEESARALARVTDDESLNSFVGVARGKNLGFIA